MASVVSMPDTGKQDMVYLAIQSEPPFPPKQPLLLVVLQSLPLADIIQNVCSQWSVENSEHHALKYADPPPNAPVSAKFGYITEENRHKLKDGDILKLSFAPPIAAKQLFKRIVSENASEKSRAVGELLSLSKDYTFALEFIKLEGIQSLTRAVEESHLANAAEKQQLSQIMIAFLELMEHSIMSWDSLSENFVGKLLNILKKSLKQEGYFHPAVVSKTLAILEAIVLNSNKFYKTVTSQISAGDVIPFLSIQEVEVKYNALAFINAMIFRASNCEAVLQELTLNRLSRYLLDDVLNYFQSNMPREIAHELYVFQCLVLNVVEGRMRRRFVAGDSRMEEDVRLLPMRAFPDEYADEMQSAPISEQHWKQLGFVKGDPQDDFSECPPGILALDCMVYFAKTKHDTFTKLLFSYTDNQCPFALGCIALTKILCQIFRIGEQPSEIGYEFIPVLVWSEEPFKEVFSIGIQLLFKTWREMRASVLDLEKVMAVVTKQITTVLQSGGSTLTSFDIFKQRLFDLSYKKITSSGDSSQLLDESMLKSKPVQELCEKIKPELLGLIKEERLRHLMEGSAFPKSSRRRDQFFYCRLSPNQKVLHFGDTTNVNEPLPIEALDKKIQVSEMRLEVGANCPHSATLKRGQTQNIFSVFYEGDEHLDFIAPDLTLYNIWVDGLSALTGKMMPSKASEEDLDTLMTMDLKIRLLDVENVTIPSVPPSIPKEPDDFDFYYKLE